MLLHSSYICSYISCTKKFFLSSPIFCFLSVDIVFSKVKNYQKIKSKPTSFSQLAGASLRTQKQYTIQSDTENIMPKLNVLKLPLSLDFWTERTLDLILNWKMCNFIPLLQPWCGVKNNKLVKYNTFSKTIQNMKILARNKKDHSFLVFHWN